MPRGTPQEVYDNIVARGEEAIKVEVAVKKLGGTTVQSQRNVARQGPADGLPAPTGKVISPFSASSPLKDRIP
jgi:hypothetical protein